MLSKKIRDIRVKMGAGLNYYHHGEVIFSCKPKSKVDVGYGSYSADVVFLYTAKGTPIKIGSYTSMGRGISLILAGGHNPNNLTNFPLDPSYVSSAGGVTIGNDVWIGDDVTIMGGVTIGDGAVVGAKSLVPKGKKLDDYGIYAGSPAKLIRYRFDRPTIRRLKELSWWKIDPKAIQENRRLFYGNLKTALKELERLKSRKP